MQNLILAIRSLRRSAGFTTVAVTTMAIGVAGSTALFSIVRGALLDPWPYAGYDRLVTLRANSPRLARTGFPLWSAAEYADIAARTDVFDVVIAGEGRGATLGAAPSVERIMIGAMTANTWPMLGVAPFLGRAFDARDDQPRGPHVAVLNYRFWRNHLGARSDVIGNTVQIDQTPFVVIGVMPPEFVWWDRDVWVPAQISTASSGRTERRWYVQARLRTGVTTSQATAALRTTADRWRRDYRLQEYDDLLIEPLPLVAETLRDVRQVLFVLLCAVALVLAVASANIATLLLIRGVRRRGEMAIKLALGAGRARLARQLLTENLLVAIGAGCAGLWLASFLLEPLVALIPAGIPAEAHIAIDWRAGVFALALAAACGGVFGIVPALRAIDGDVASGLKDTSRRTAIGSSRALDAFMAAQFALALVVLSATLTVVPSFERTLAASPGFDDANVLTVRVAFPAQAAGAEAHLVADVTRSLSALSGVVAVAASTTPPIGPGPRASFSPGGSATQLDANIDAITPGFFTALRTPLVGGRDFDARDDSARERVAIVNATAAARLWPTSRAVGSRLLWRERAGADAELVVVGIAADMKRDALLPAAPAVFVPAAQEPAQTMTVVLRSPGDQSGLFNAVRSAVAAAAPAAPVYAPRTLARLRADALGSERLAAVLLAAFAGLALVLSMVGMYGVTRYTVEQRTGELAVRVALGATRRDLLFLVLARSLKNVAAGAVVGAFGSWIAVRTVSASIVGVSGSIPVVFIAAAIPLTIATLTAAYMPARRAGAVSPIEALKGS